jgi:hypothetical protein
MPLIHSDSKQAFEKNIKREIAAGRPPRQAVAIAYTTRRDAMKKTSAPHHSSHTEELGSAYEQHVSMGQKAVPHLAVHMAKMDQESTK